MSLENSFMNQVQVRSFALALLMSTVPTGCGEEDPEEAAFTIKSSSVTAGAPIGDEFTCQGKAFGAGSSPDLSWEGAPEGTLSFAVLLKDQSIWNASQTAADEPDIGDEDPNHSFHWAIWDIPAVTTSLPKALPITQFPLGNTAQQLSGGPPFISPGAYGYFGPCPNLMTLAVGAPADAPHNDAFILYALKVAQLTITAGSTLPQIAALFEFNKLASVELGFTATATPTTCPGFPEENEDTTPSPFANCN